MRNEKSGTQNKKTPQTQIRLTWSARWRKHFSLVLLLCKLPKGHAICELCRGGVRTVFLPGPVTSPRASMFSQKYPSNVLQLPYFDWFPTTCGFWSSERRQGLKILCNSSISLIYCSCCPKMQSRALLLMLHRCWGRFGTSGEWT